MPVYPIIPYILIKFLSFRTVMAASVVVDVGVAVELLAEVSWDAGAAEAGVALEVNVEVATGAAIGADLEVVAITAHSTKTLLQFRQANADWLLARAVKPSRILTRYEFLS